jgi:membrane protein
MDCAPRGGSSTSAQPQWLGRTWLLLRDAALAWVDDYAASIGAALSYYTVFSMAPLLLIVISIAGLVFGEAAARGEILDQLAALVGVEGAHVLETALEGLNQPRAGWWGTGAGVVALLIGASTVFAELQSAMDRIWRAPPQAPSGAPLPAGPGAVWQLLRVRLLSLGMVLGVGFLLLVSLVASAALAALEKWWAPWFGDLALLASALNFGLSFALVTVLFAMIYKWMPRVRLAWRDVAVGAVLTALLFTLGKSLIGLYIGRSGVASVFGAAASLVVLLLWVYYSAQVFLFGAEITWVYALRHGSLQGTQPAVGAAQPAQPLACAQPAQHPQPRTVP